MDNVWLEKVATVWKELEKFVQNGKVISIGVADFNLKALTLLVDKVDIKPCVNHFSIDGCCVVSFKNIYIWIPMINNFVFRFLQNFKHMLKNMIFNS